MKIQSQIQDKLNTQFSPSHLEVINESHQHNVPPGSESHFKVIVVSESFQGQLPLPRHRAVNQCLAEELANDIHALSISAFTQAEWEKKNGQVRESPQCLGGSKHG